MRDSMEMEQALELLLNEIIPTETTEQVSLLDACGRVSAAEVLAMHDLPPFDRSPLDGYALRSGDIAGADRQHGVRLEVAITVLAGSSTDAPLQPGQAAMVTTGSRLPKGVDCVVRQEQTRREGRHVWVYDNPGKNQNYVYRGEDIRQGDLILAKGQTIESAHVGILAGQGYGSVRVFCPAKVGLISTGDELVDNATALSGGKIYDSNSLMLAARAKQLGASPSVYKSIKDDPGELQRAIANMLAENDMAVTTGGASVGVKDLVPSIGELMDARLLFRRLNHKPGGNAFGWVIGGKVLLCLSGNPFAALAAFELLAAPSILKLLGRRQYGHVLRSGKLMGGFAKPSRRRRFIRALYDGGEVRLPATHASGCISSMAGCNCLVDIPAGSPALGAGADVGVILLHNYTL